MMMETGDFCVYCGGRDDLTDDHVPPECIFPKPRPANLVKVRGCKSCNCGASKDDEHFRMMLCMSEEVGESTEAQKHWPVILRALRRPQASGMKTALLRSMHPVGVMTPGGLFLGTQVGFNVSLERIFRVVKRIVRGLYFKERGQRLPEGYDVLVHCDDTLISMPSAGLEHLHQRVLLPLAATDPKIIAAGVFFYRYLAAEDNPAASAWALTFYERKSFLATVGPAMAAVPGAPTR
jgi:hypothetical protein